MVAVLGVALAAASWWIYFDVVALVSARRLGEAEEGRAQNELARDSYSYIHLLLVAGIVLVAFGLKETIAHDRRAPARRPGLRPARRHRHLPARPGRASATATSHSVNRQRLGLAIVLLILIPVATAVPALSRLAVVVVLIWAMIAFEHRSYGERRDQLRHEAAVSHG